MTSDLADLIARLERAEGPDEVNPDMPENTGEGVAAIPALALVIAALRARD